MSDHTIPTRKRVHKPKHPVPSKRIILPCLFLFFSASSSLAAQPKLNTLFPAGAERGTTLSVHAAGTFGKWPVKVWVDRPGIAATAADEKNTLHVTVAPDAAPGVYWLRVYDDDGASSPRPFIVGSLTELTEDEPNDDRLKPQSIPTQPVVVNGRLNKSNDLDSFAVPLYRGQTLLLSVEANRTLGSPMDSVIQIVSPDGFVLGENDDYHDLDSQLVLVVPADGVYVVRIFGFPATPTATIGYAGGDDFIYRLTVTTGPFIEYAYPLAVAAGGPGGGTGVSGTAADAAIKLRGWNIPRDLRPVSVRPLNAGALLEVGMAGMAGRAVVRFESHEAIVEQEPNGRDVPQDIPLPVTVTGRMDKRGDVDVFRFRAKKGEQWVFRAEARALGFPLDPLLRVSDATGKSIAEVDDSAGGRDVELTLTVPDDGEFHVLIRDLNGQGGDPYVYRLVGARSEPAYTLKVAADSFGITPGKPLEIPVTVERTNGFAGEVDIVVEGLWAGVSVAAAKSAGTGDSSKAVKITLSSNRKGPASGPIRIVGRVSGNPTLERTALAPLTSLSTVTPDLWLTLLP